MDYSDLKSDGEGRSSSMLKGKHDDDVSGLEAMLRRRKQLKTMSSVSSPVSKMNWTKQNELLILTGIVDYEKETKLSYRSDWEVFFRYIKDLIDANFSKKQLVDKVKKLKKRFSDNIASGKGPSFPNTHDNQVFKLAMKIWSINDTEPAPNNIMDQPKVTVTSGEMDNNNGDKDNGEEQFCLLEVALEASCFQSLGKYQQNLMLQNLRNLGPRKTKELTDEWKALLLEELHLNVKKQSFSVKLANA